VQIGMTHTLNLVRGAEFSTLCSHSFFAKINMMAGSPPDFYTTKPTSRNPDSPAATLTSTSPPLTLRLALPTDAPALLRIFTDSLNTEHDASTAGLNTPPAIENLISRWRNLTTPLTRLNFVVVAAGGEVVGVGGTGCIYTREGDGKRVADVGVMINPEARRKGYAGASLRMTTDYLLRVLKLDEVTVEMRAANVGMRALMEEKCSEFRSREREDLKFGDEISYRVGRDEWISSSKV